MNVVVFSGTTEGRSFSRALAALGAAVTVCVATELGAEEQGRADGITVRTGRLDADGMTALLRGAALCVDATHPYAAEATRNIRAAAAAAGVEYHRLLRPASPLPAGSVVQADAARAAAYLADRPGRVLLATGAKELPAFAALDPARLYPRVLPTLAGIAACEAAGIPHRNILAMQGPFTEELNTALLRQFHISYMVTKDGGAAGGIEEKIEAARSCKARVIMIERPHEEGGHSCTEALLWARRILGLSRPPLFPMLTDMEGRSAVIAGGGRIAARRAATLIKCGAAVTVVSPEFCPEFKEMKCRLVRKSWEPEDLDGAALSVAATDDEKVNAAIGAAAKERGIPVSVADNAAECSFFFPSLVTSGEVSASVSAGALSPALTHRLAERLRSVWDEWVKEERAALEEKKDG